MPREVLVTKAIRLSPALIANLKREAANNAMNLSEYIRAILYRRKAEQLRLSIKRGRRHARGN